MSKYLSKSDYQKLFEFSSELLTLNYEEMQYKILKLLDEMYGYKISTFTTFKGKYLQNVIGHNFEEKYIDLYKESYVEKDVFNSYMLKFIESIELCQNQRLTENQTIISINDIYSNDDDFRKTEYYQFLNAVGMHYQFNLMLNAEDTVVLFRSRDEGLIEEKENIILGHLWNIISHLYNQKKELMLIQKENYFLKRSAEIAECGTFILNKEFKILSYNKQALDFGAGITEENNLNLVISELIKELITEENSKLSKSSYYTQKKGYKIRCETESILTKNKYIERYYLITITKESSRNNISKYDRVDKIFNLTKRELEICTLISQGLSNQDIADTLTISQYTVRTHIENIFRKLEVNNRLAAISKINEFIE